MITEADTCRQYVVPGLQAAGWDADPHAILEQRTFTDGRIVVAGGKATRQKQKRADYLLRYTRDLTLAVVEAKVEYKEPGDGLQQALDYAEILGLPFAYSTNGKSIVEHDFLTGSERDLTAFPTPDALWLRYRAARGLDEATARRLLTPSYHEQDKSPRYYQEIAINRAVEAILTGRPRVLLTMATGTGKTQVAFQICWKLWNARWNRAGAPQRRPRILYLADRNILVDDPKDKTFTPFGEARTKIEHGKAEQSRELYFSTYQAIAEDESRSGLYREYPRDFFDLVIVDECHRGSARANSTWRGILTYFAPAAQLGMTATPFREESRDTYAYFGNPIYVYSLRDGIEDGFLAPYRVHRVVTQWDAAGWRPSAGDLDRYGRTIPDDEYQTRDFERIVALRARTEAVAAHLTDFLKRTDRFGKTLVFCVDQEHALEMRSALARLNADLLQHYPDYVCRVTASEGEIGRGHLSNFQDPERLTPAILTTSQLLTTGVDAPTTKNVVLLRVIGSMAEFKQIIGRGTRVREDYGKLFFNILDYTGTATAQFADPEFDGVPELATQEEIDAAGRVVATTDMEQAESGIAEPPEPYIVPMPQDGAPAEPRKFYFDSGRVEIVAHLVYELDAAGKQLRVVRYTDYAAEGVRTLYPDAAPLRAEWADPAKREAIIERLAARGIDVAELAGLAQQPDADPFDLLCHVAFGAPLLTRRERAERLRRKRPDFFGRFGPDARAVLEELLDQYAAHGIEQFSIPDTLKVPPLSERGNPSEIARLFGGAQQLRAAVADLQALLYAA